MRPIPSISDDPPVEDPGKSGGPELTGSVDLIVFTVRGRAELLKATLQRLDRINAGPFASRIISIDGNDQAVIKVAQDWNADQILVSNEQRGYFSNIEAGVSAAKAPYVFWLEDDWLLERWPTQADIIDFLTIWRTVAQVRIRKTPRLSFKERDAGVVRFAQSEFACGGFMYSCNPHWARRLDLVAFLQAARQGELPVSGNIELVFTAWHQTQGSQFGVLATPPVMAVHTGVIGTRPDNPALHDVVQPGTQDSESKPLLRLDKTVSVSPVLTTVRNAAYCLARSMTCIVRAPFSVQARHFLWDVWEYWHT